ncbi:MAG: DNRLRE domain-containing protein, partial [Burkholderiales bacterium]|nr:DNRLRE domain-containing protein [Burkholderiales bacterium]
LTAVAVDNAGASTTSAPVSLTVTPAPAGGTVTLQDGVSGYAGTRDTYLSVWHRTTNFGASNRLNEAVSYTDLVRFAIFQSEGGPVPNGATIVSATLSLYKSSSYDYTYQVSRMLRDWSETQATWNQWQSGQAWSVAGAKGVGTDYAATPDATVYVGWSAQWLTADVTTGVQAMATGTPNYGWRLVGVSGNGNDKSFWSREYAADPTLRPKLVIQYTIP